MRITVQTIPHEEHKFTTIGYWSATDDEVVFTISELPNWRWMVSVLIHELIEWMWCEAHGVTTEECDAFDAMYEEGYRNGTISIDKEAGYDKKCPYYKGHVWGDRISWIFEKIMHVDVRNMRRYTGILLDSPRFDSIANDDVNV